MEKESPAPCPFLPAVTDGMSYRDLREGRARDADTFFEVALKYTQYLWQAGLPARAILALCRAIYIDPNQLDPKKVQPYQAYRWMAGNYKGRGFFGNPRLSFFNQASRMAEEKALNRMRAWALWHLTIRERPDLPPVAEDRARPPSFAEIAAFLDTHGLNAEGRHFLEVLNR